MRWDTVKKRHLPVRKTLSIFIVRQSHLSVVDDVRTLFNKLSSKSGNMKIHIRDFYYIITVIILLS